MMMMNNRKRRGPRKIDWLWQQWPQATCNPQMTKHLTSPPQNPLPPTMMTGQTPRTNQDASCQAPNWSWHQTSKPQSKNDQHQNVTPMVRGYAGGGTSSYAPRLNWLLLR
jgi:hypothetical protein